MLPKLPGELRDMIIDHVLLTPLPVPSHDFITYSPRTYGTITPSSRFPSTYSTQPLLHTNHQLRAETTLRASKLDIPLVLDICCWIDVSCRKNSRCVLTWLNQRWGEPATWGRIPRMDIRIRVLPIDLEHRPGGGMHLVDLGLQREGVLGYVASMALRVARKPICTVLSAQHHIATARLVNSIRHIHTSFGAAAHEPGDPGVLHAPGSIVAAIAQRLSSRAVASSTLFPDTHLRRWLETIRYSHMLGLYNSALQVRGTGSFVGMELCDMGLMVGERMWGLSLGREKRWSSGSRGGRWGGMMMMGLDDLG
jgi:hypothetical protein